MIFKRPEAPDCLCQTTNAHCHMPRALVTAVTAPADLPFSLESIQQTVYNLTIIVTIYRYCYSKVLRTGPGALGEDLGDCLLHRRGFKECRDAEQEPGHECCSSFVDHTDCYSTETEGRSKERLNKLQAPMPLRRSIPSNCEPCRSHR